ncbi:hypothetical protein [Haladaptatus sp. DFWS20]|uniref:hypothetical protein n=1 Tax=Haladaptatus sp. DFWS20 TaxID=3403467 RepID=UPI003EBE019B
MNLLGVAGGVALFFPKQSLRFSTALTYEQPDTVTWNDGFIAAVRGFGVLYLVLAYSAFKKRRSR